MTETQTQTQNIAPVAAAVAFALQTKPVATTITFRSVRVKDEAGNSVLDAEGKPTYTSREKIDVTLAVPTRQGIVDLLFAAADEGVSEEVLKAANLVDEVVSAFLFEQAQELAKQNTSLTTSNFPISEIDWIKIANAPEAERKSRGISKETWAEFAEDYISNMPEITGKDVERVKKAAGTFILKFANIAANKEAIRLLQAQLAVYLEKAPSAQNYIDVLEYLNKKAETLLAAELVSSDDF